MDGLIFQPSQTPYATKRNDPYLLKFKFPSMRSVDLSAVYNLSKGQIQLSCNTTSGPLDVSGKGGGDVTVFGKFDKYRLLADINDGMLPGNKLRIVEVVYDVNYGVWRYLKLRKDKEDPNSSDTLIGVLMEQAENITQEDLIRELSSHS
jgi:hypothetical protein